MLLSVYSTSHRGKEFFQNHIVLYWTKKDGNSKRFRFLDPFIRLVKLSPHKKQAKYKSRLDQTDPDGRTIKFK